MLVYERVREACRASGLKNTVIAERLGVTKYWLSDRLTGRVVLAADDVVRFADALDVDPSTFFQPAPPSGPQEVRSGQAADDREEDVLFLHVLDELISAWRELPQIERKLMREMFERRRRQREQVVEPDDDDDAMFPSVVVPEEREA